MRKRWSDYEKEMRLEIEIRKSISSSHAEYTAQKDSLEKEVNRTKKFITISEYTLKRISSKKEKFMNTHIQELEEVVQISLDTIEPEKEYGAVILPEPYRGKNGLTLNLKLPTGDLVPPHILEGDMLNQVLTYSSSGLLSYKKGCKIIFYDECFGSANSRSLINIRKLVQMFSEMGITLILVSQNPILLKGLERNRIELVQEKGAIARVEQSFIPADDDSMSDEEFISLMEALSVS